MSVPKITFRTVTIDKFSVMASWAGRSWAVDCDVADCNTRIVGFRDEGGALRGAMAHLIWHVNGKPTCRDCGAWLNYRSSRRCRKGTCEVAE